LSLDCICEEGHHHHHEAEEPGPEMYKNAIDVALSNNQIRAVGKIIDHIVKF